MEKPLISLILVCLVIGVYSYLASVSIYRVLTHEVSILFDYRKERTFFYNVTMHNILNIVAITSILYIGYILWAVKLKIPTVVVGLLVIAMVVSFVRRLYKIIYLLKVCETGSLDNLSEEDKKLVMKKRQLVEEIIEKEEKHEELRKENIELRLEGIYLKIMSWLGE